MREIGGGQFPALRERREDIRLLVQYFVSKQSRRMRKKTKSVPRQAMEVLANVSWPGNVRELQNLIERAVILTQGSEWYVPRERGGPPPERLAPTPCPTFTTPSGGPSSMLSRLLRARLPARVVRQ